MKVLPLPKSITVGRLVKALGQSDSVYGAAEIASKYRDTPQVAACLQKSATDPMGLGNSSALAQYEVSNDAIEALTPLSCYERLRPLARRVPFRTVFRRSDLIGDAGFYAEAAAQGATQGAFSSFSLDHKRADSIVVLTKDTLRFGGVASDMLVTQTVVKALALKLDGVLLEPSNAGDDATPTSLTYAAAEQSSSGSTAQKVDDDLSAMLKTLSASNTLGNPVFLMSCKVAAALGSLRSTAGEQYFPGVTVKGGFIRGYPIIASQSAPDIIVLLDASQLVIADDEQVSITRAQYASIQMQTSPSAGAQPLVSLYQNGLVAVRSERYANWMLAFDDFSVSPHKRPGIVWLDASSLV